jgi:spore maturation protein CgeB
MAAMGWCPSGRLFEAAACGTAILTDEWDGLANFYEPGEEILPVHTTEDVLAALDLPDETIARIARAARERTLDQHTSRHRAADLVAICENMASEKHPQRFEQVESKPCGG